jgi:hypothetical protein
MNLAIEPPRFGLTGPSHLIALRFEFMEDALAYSIDAPAYIARGSLTSTAHKGSEGLMQPYHYICATEARP